MAFRLLTNLQAKFSAVFKHLIHETSRIHFGNISESNCGGAPCAEKMLGFVIYLKASNGLRLLTNPWRKLGVCDSVDYAQATVT